MPSLKKIFHLLSTINLKTLYFNFKYLPFATAIKFPVFVSRNYILKKCEGRIDIVGPKHGGMIRLGYGNVGIFDKSRSKGIWECSGIVRFEGRSFLGHGSKISVGPEGELTFGNDVSITAESSIVCFKKIDIGSESLISWQVTIMDTDFHTVYNASGECVNGNKEVIIGKHVWIGTRCTILKGSEIADNSVIAACTLVSGLLSSPNCVYGGQPAKMIKENTSWKL